MSNILKVITEQAHPEWQDNIDNYQMWRAAIEGRLDADKTRASIPDTPKFAAIVPRAKLLNQNEDDGPLRKLTSWLFRFEYESDWAFHMRSLLANDFGDSGRVVNSYVGHLSRAPHEAVFRLNDELDEKINTNIDNDGTNLSIFENLVAAEVLGMGRAHILVKPTPQGQIHARIIPREDIIDWERDAEGTLVFIKYREIIAQLKSLERVWFEQVTLITTDEVVIAQRELRSDDWKLLEPQPNPIGRIPFCVTDMGDTSRPIIEVVAKLQVNMLNADSELRQIIRNQCLSLLQIPEGAADQIEAFSANSYIEVSPDDANTTKWVAYPAQTLDPYFKYLNEWLVPQIMQSSNLHRRDEQNLSGVSKQWDFMETQTILSVLVDTLEPAMECIIQLFADWADISNPEIMYRIEKKFDDAKLVEKLDNVIKAMTIRLGSTAEKKLREQLVAEMVKSTPEESKQISEELDEIKRQEDTEPFSTGTEQLTMEGEEDGNQEN